MNFFSGLAAVARRERHGILQKTTAAAFDPSNRGIIGVSICTTLILQFFQND